MWSPISIKLYNLNTHKDTEISFLRGGVTTITGKNEFDGLKSNGSGKSTIIEAISIAINNSVIRKGVQMQDMIRDGESSASISVKLSNASSGSVMDIQRKIYRGKTPSKVIVHINGAQVSLSSVKHADEFIMSTIGISSEDLYNYYIVSKSRYKSFYNSSDQDKKSLISRFSKADIVDLVFDDIQIETSDLSNKILILDSDIRSLSSMIDGLEEQKLNLPTPEEAYKNIVSVYNLDIENIYKGIASNEETIKSINTDLSSIKGRVNGFELSVAADRKLLASNEDLFEKKSKYVLSMEKRMTNVIERKSKVQDDIASIENGALKELLLEKSANEETRNQISLFLSGSIACPECNHEFVPKSDTSVEDARKDLSIMDDEIANNQKAIDMMRDRILKMKQVLEDIESLRSEISLDVRKINRELDTIRQSVRSKKDDINRGLSSIDKIISNESTLRARILNIESSIKADKSAIEDIKAKIASAKDRDFDESLRLIESMTVNKRKELESAMEDIKSLRVKEAESQTWVSNFKKFYTHLANKSINALEQRVNKTLSSMSLPISVSIDGYKMLASGEVRDKISASVYKSGVMFGSFFKCSEGEKAYVDISTIIANQNFINSSADSGGLDMLMIDEITESLDPDGVSNVIKILEKTGKTCIAITHVDISSSNSSNMVVKKCRDGVSRVSHAV